MGYSNDQRKYWAQRPADKIHYMTVEFFHPDFGYIRLVADQFEPKDFDVDGNIETFEPAALKMPRVTNQDSDSTRVGSIEFGRIGFFVRQKLQMITPAGAIKDPINVIIRHYENDVVNPVYIRKMFVGKNGITIGIDAVKVSLAVDNPAKLTKANLFYDPEIWIGLQTT